MGKRREIKDGMLACLDCGPKPLREFLIVLRKGKPYLDSRCHVCRRFRCAARNHNIPASRYKAIMEAAKGKCAICHKAKDRLELDHCHKTGQLRGVLCQFCNQNIAPFENNPAFAEAAMRYLDFWRSVPLSDEERREGEERNRRLAKLREGSIWANWKSKRPRVA